MEYETEEDRERKNDDYWRGYNDALRKAAEYIREHGDEDLAMQLLSDVGNDY